jgi:hypothetical protein
MRRVLELPATTLAELTGDSDPGFTLRVYAREGRDSAAVVKDVLRRAAGAKIGRQHGPTAGKQTQRRGSRRPAYSEKGSCVAPVATSHR